MHTNRISLARKILVWVGAAIGLMLLTGCEFTLTNLTPSTLPENPSQIYTLQLRVTPKMSAVVPGSIDPHVIVDGQSYKMAKSSLGNDIYEFEYQLPSGREELVYYYLVNYKVTNNNQTIDRESYTDLLHTKVAHRYVLSLEANRGPVGARVGVIGRGFTANDQVNVGGTPARTVYESPNALSFFVPALDASRNYPVVINSSSGNSPVGTFRVDPATIQITPSALNLRTGERQPITFTLPNAAPAGGLLLDVTTDVPESVIMPEAIVPAGQNSVTISVEGGKSGNGSLFLKGYGTGEVSVPVSVGGR